MSIRQRPSRFAVVSLLVLLAFGCGLNLFIAHQAITWGPKPDLTVYLYPESPDPSDWPEIPWELTHNGDVPTEWQLASWWFVKQYAVYIEDPARYQQQPLRVDTNSFPVRVENNDDPMFPIEMPEPEPQIHVVLYEERYGAPVVTRSSKYAQREQVGALPEHAWPIWSGKRSPLITYHPLGLILNPTIYALPPWLLLMGTRWACITRRTRRRKHLGLCPRCAYDMDGLSVCPECGTSSSHEPAR